MSFGGALKAFLRPSTLHLGSNHGPSELSSYYVHFPSRRVHALVGLMRVCLTWRPFKPSLFATQKRVRVLPGCLSSSYWGHGWGAMRPLSPTPPASEPRAGKDREDAMDHARGLNFHWQVAPNLSCNHFGQLCTFAGNGTEDIHSQILSTSTPAACAHRSPQIFRS